VHQTEPVAPVVLDVLSPCAALDVDEYVRLGLSELYSYDGTQVAGGVAVGEEVGGEAAVW